MASPAMLEIPVSRGDGSKSLALLSTQFVGEIREALSNDRLVWPSMPSVVLKIRSVMQDPGSSVDDITRATSMDPALSAQLLRAANSVYYGASNPCRDLRGAVVRLGAKALEHVVMLLVVARVFSVGKRGRIQPHLARMWRHSTLVGSLCECLAQRTEHLEPDVALLAGLIHDIGALPVLVRAAGTPQLLDNRQLLDPLVDALHCEVGHAMLEAWQFPGELVTIATEHEDLDRDVPGELDYTDLVIAANLISHMGTRHRHAETDWSAVPAMAKIALNPTLITEILEGAKQKEVALRNL